MIQGRLPKGLQDFRILKLWRNKRKGPVRVSQWTGNP